MTLEVIFVLRLDYLSCVLTDNTNDVPFIEQGVYYPYIRNRNVYYCPLDNKGNQDFIRRVQRVSSYIMNGAVCGFGHDNRPKTKISMFKSSAYVQWEPKVNNYGGSYAYNSGLDASQKPDNEEGIGNRHGKGAGILGFDSRVLWISISQFNREAILRNNPPERGLLWCSPYTPNGT